MIHEMKTEWDKIYNVVVAIVALVLFIIVGGMLAGVIYQTWSKPEPKRPSCFAPAHTPIKGKGLK